MVRTTTERKFVCVRDVHPFQMPEYSSLRFWLCGSGADTVQLFDGRIVKRKSDGTIVDGAAASVHDGAVASNGIPRTTST